MWDISTNMYYIHRWNYYLFVLTCIIMHKEHSYRPVESALCVLAWVPGLRSLWSSLRDVTVKEQGFPRASHVPSSCNRSLVGSTPRLATLTLLFPGSPGKIWEPFHSFSKCPIFWPPMEAKALVPAMPWPGPDHIYLFSSLLFLQVTRMIVSFLKTKKETDWNARGKRQWKRIKQ